MAKQLAFAIVTPHTLRKSRTGGVLARLMSRTGLDLVGARMFAPGPALVRDYSALVASKGFYPARIQKRFAEYVAREFAPDAETGRRQRAMLLLFEGDNAINKVRAVAGSPTTSWDSGDTIRGTFGECITGPDGELTYFEPAVLVARDAEHTAAVLKLWAKHSVRDGGLVEEAADVSVAKGVESTLVMLKPDNFRFPSLRAGNIVDILSRSGLRIVAMKKFSMTVAQAEDFYGPVRAILREKFTERVSEKIHDIVQDNIEVSLTEEAEKKITSVLGPMAGDAQFESIVHFMTGHRPTEVKDSQKKAAASENCIALVYRGKNAIKTIRQILGPTDPSKAEPGSVRKEFGSNIMVNAAHASDSVPSAEREMGILMIEEDNIRSIIRKYYK